MLQQLLPDHTPWPLSSSCDAQHQPEQEKEGEKEGGRERRMEGGREGGRKGGREGRRGTVTQDLYMFKFDCSYVLDHQPHSQVTTMPASFPGCSQVHSTVCVLPKDENECLLSRGSLVMNKGR